MKSSIFKTVTLAVAGCLFTVPAMAHSNDAGETAEYVAHLHAVNTAVTGLETTGEARFTIHDGKLTISVEAENVPAGIMHLQHFHGFKTQQAAQCPSAAADANGDGIIDLIETHASSGTTMVPFTEHPASMKVITNTYPKASEAGTYTYRQTVPLAELKQNFSEKFGGQSLNLDSRVVYIHGVLPQSNLPDSVASLGDIPAHVTLPIACGEIEPVVD